MCKQSVLAHPAQKGPIARHRSCTNQNKKMLHPASASPVPLCSHTADNPTVPKPHILRPHSPLVSSFQRLWTLLLMLLKLSYKDCVSCTLRSLISFSQPVLLVAGVSRKDIYFKRASRTPEDRWLFLLNPLSYGAHCDMKTTLQTALCLPPFPPLAAPLFLFLNHTARNLPILQISTVQRPSDSTHTCSQTMRLNL